MLEQPVETQLPPYAPMMAAYHRAHATELYTMIAGLPVQPGACVLDVACGSGRYTTWLAERVGRQGTVIGIDISAAYLATARRRAQRAGVGAQVRFQLGDVAMLPFDDQVFDLVWCAQSLFSLPDITLALAELRRVTRVGGTVAIFENDLLHQVMLPWPADLELVIRQAQLHALATCAPEMARFAIGRYLVEALVASGLTDCTLMPYTTVRQTPLSSSERRYLRYYLNDLASSARPCLDPFDQARFDAFITPGSAHFLLDRPNLSLVYIDFVATARRPY